MRIEYLKLKKQDFENLLKQFAALKSEIETKKNIFKGITLIAKGMPFGSIFEFIFKRTPEGAKVEAYEYLLNLIDTSMNVLKKHYNEKEEIIPLNILKTIEESLEFAKGQVKELDQIGSFNAVLSSIKNTIKIGEKIVKTILEVIPIALIIGAGIGALLLFTIFRRK